MKISKEQLCYDCRRIMMSDDLSVEQFLDSKGYNMPNGFIIGNYTVLPQLRQKGGCPTCIALFERATKS